MQACTLATNLIVVVVGATLGFTLGTRVAVASPSARLAYARGAGSEICPDEAALRAAIAKRVGYDPFFPWATQTVIVQIENRGRGFVARVQVLDANGVVHGERTLPPQAECTEAVAAAALSVSLALSESSPTAEAGAAAAPEAQSGADETPEPPVVVQAAALERGPAAAAEPDTARRAVARGQRLLGIVWLGAGASVGASPALGFALAFGAGLRFKPFEFGIEARYDAPSSASITPRAELTTETFSVGVVPCAMYRWAFGCLGFAMGRLGTETRGITSPRNDAALVGFGSARAGVQLAVTIRLAMRLHLEGRILLNPPEVAIAGERVYRASPVAVFLFATPIVQF